MLETPLGASLVILLKPKARTRKPKQYRPYKSKFLKCYGVLLDNGEFDTQFFARGDYAFVLPIKGDFIESEGKGKKGTYLNVREQADWLSVSAYKNARRGRTEKNISHVLCGFLDLDGPYKNEDVELPLTDDLIRQRCLMLGLPMPKIIESSPNRYHIKFYYLSPESIKRKWKIKAVQRGLHEAFKDLGSDVLVSEDLTHFLRNENQENAVNKKRRCERKPKVTVVEEGQLCTLDQLYRILKKHGYIKPKDAFKRPSNFSPDYTPIGESRSRLIAFLKDNPGYLSTYEELADTLKTALRTFKRIVGDLRQEGKLKTELVGRWGNRKTRFITQFFEVHSKEIVNTSLSVCASSRSSNGSETGEESLGISLGKEKKEPVFAFSQALVRAKAIGLSCGVRNWGFFGFALWLSVSKRMSYDEISRELYPVLILTPGFSRREFEKTVRSACRERYRYCISKEKFERVLISLGLNCFL